MRRLLASTSLSFALFFSTPHAAWAAFSNYNTILIGDRAAGMGSAFTALTDDAAGGAYYNPASLIRMRADSISASVSVYNKYDTRYGNQSDYAQAPLRINRGFFRSLPSSSGSLVNFGKFALGLSVVLPDYDYFSGEVRSTDSTSSFLSYIDESLWVGGTFSVRLTPTSSAGLTAYYTARSLDRSVSDALYNGTTSAVITTEEKNLTNNSLVYVIGYQKTLGHGFQTGVSFRFPSIEISGNGSFYRSVVTTQPYNLEVTSQNALKSETRIPSRIGLGIAYEEPHHKTFSFDIHHYGRENYRDLDYVSSAEDAIEHEPTTNFALGSEYYLKEWLRWRLGVYTNFSSHPNPVTTDELRRGDHIEMWGWSTNFAVSTNDKTSFTIGGYYTGGRGKSTQRVGNALQLIEKNTQIFTMLIGGGYNF
jgi:hypothetical protein